MKILATKPYMKIFDMTASNLFHRYRIQDTVCEITHSNKKFREELIAYFPFKEHGPRRKLRLTQLFFATGMCLSSHCLATIRGYTERPIDSRLIRQGPHGKRLVQQFLYVSWIRWRGYVYTEPLPSNVRGIDIHSQTDRRDLWSTPVRSAHMPWYTCQVSWSLVQAFKSW
jgi:hypothetical protein